MTSMPPPAGAPRDKHGNIIPTVAIAPAGTSAHWQYTTVVVSKTMMGGKMRTESIDQQLTSMGMQGWELVSVLYDVNIAGARDGLLMFFKRRS